MVLCLPLNIKSIRPLKLPAEQFPSLPLPTRSSPGLSAPRQPAPHPRTGAGPPSVPLRARGGSAGAPRPLLAPTYFQQITTSSGRPRLTCPRGGESRGGAAPGPFFSSRRILGLPGPAPAEPAARRRSSAEAPGCPLPLSCPRPTALPALKPPPGSAPLLRARTDSPRRGRILPPSGAAFSPVPWRCRPPPRAGARPAPHPFPAAPPPPWALFAAPLSGPHRCRPSRTATGPPSR